MLRIWAEIFIFFPPLSTPCFFLFISIALRIFYYLSQVFHLLDFYSMYFQFLLSFHSVLVLEGHSDRSQSQAFLYLFNKCLQSTCLVPRDRSASPFTVLYGWSACHYLQQFIQFHFCSFLVVFFIPLPAVSAFLLEIVLTLS